MGLSIATLYISIHALRVEGDMPDAFSLLKSTISIHALRVEGDRGDGFVLEQGYNISIHALRVEGDAAERSRATAGS